MGYISVTNNFVALTKIRSAQVNQNFADIVAGLSDGSKDLKVASVAAAFTGNLTGNADTATNATNAGYATTAGTANSVAGSNVSGNIPGNANNITAYTINQNLGTANSPTFSELQLSNFSMVRVKRTTTQTLANPSVNETIIFDFIDLDRLSEYNPATGIFTAAHTGYYFVTGHVTRLDHSAIDTNLLSVSIYRNGAQHAISNLYSTIRDTSAENSSTCEINCIVLVGAGDTINICAWLYPGGAGHLNIAGSAQLLTYMCIHRII